MAKDPICGMNVDEKTNLKSEYMGKTYYFCSQTCKTTFDKNPTKYVKETGSHHSCCCC
ncbi:MAG: YHS domain-containing protein [Candidatus Bathyarchaeia archaeon]|nr:YHS domain-containing protein [Candidatus Bathyarchaeota archaeon A05DMB-4]MDH7595736.1 YHS domain-containing protein [Candidatus Bathyarchaeota archaeon]